VGGHGLRWIFIHGTDFVDRGLIVLFFGLFFAIFRHFFLLSPLANFSADALGKGASLSS